MNHPAYPDSPQGTSIEWNQSSPDDTVEIIVWRGYSSKVGEYYATSAQFSIDRDTKTIQLEHVSIKIPYSPWDDFLTNPASWISDHMKREVRAFVSKETGSSYWRVNL